MKKRIWKRIKKAGTAALAAAIMLGNSALYQGNAEEQAEILFESDAKGEYCEQERVPLEGDGEKENIFTEEEIREEETEDILAGEADSWKDENLLEKEKNQETDIFTAEEENKEEDPGHGEMETEEDFEEEEVPGEENPSETEADKEKTAEFILKVRPETETARAGSRILYRVTVENTGEIPLENLKFQEDIGGEELSGQWETVNGEPLVEERGILLEQGQEKCFYLYISLPESWEKPVDLHLTASARYYSLEGWKELTDRADLTTKVLPLKAEFEVTKTADRSIAAAGDQIFFQICIRNTGERTLHSVLTTEKFQMEGMTARFLEKEGVTLNRDRTKALIKKIDPGYSFSLQAAVTVSEDVGDSELINEVEVTTEETGKRAVSAREKIQIYGKQEEENIEISEEENAEAAAEPISSNPKTGDGSQGEIWVGICLSSLAAAGLLLRKTRR